MDLTAKGQITERFTSAVGQLGDDQLAVRLGGIYALERIAHESPKDQGIIMNVLAGFLRENSKAPKMPSKESSAPKTPEARTAMPQPLHTVPTDIEAAALVLGRRDVANDPPGFELNLTSVDLRGAQLEGVNFSKAWIMGADFSGARLTGANFSYAKLKPGEVDELTDWASRGSVNFKGAVLDKVNFSDSLLRGAIFAGTWFPQAELNKADFGLSDFRGSVVAQSDFSGSSVAASNFSAARMNSAVVDGSDFTASTVVDAELSDVDFRRAVRGPKEYQIGNLDKKKRCTGKWVPTPVGCP
ncbi:pentapeptide repeat-containing protein [Streptomyces inhibens]|uniref:pentapeptide repeat-containing protein n=1 Tax=Streptomyces inhibens TaxID=2293571 RepID=UPI0015F2962B|nr:pentapeptide repeat-containing protein [Streptomyces inhibens]